MTTGPTEARIRSAVTGIRMRTILDDQWNTLVRLYGEQLRLLEDSTPPDELRRAFLRQHNAEAEAWLDLIGAAELRSGERDALDRAAEVQLRPHRAAERWELGPYSLPRFHAAISTYARSR